MTRNNWRVSWKSKSQIVFNDCSMFYFFIFTKWTVHKFILIHTPNQLSTLSFYANLLQELVSKFYF